MPHLIYYHPFCLSVFCFCIYHFISLTNIRNIITIYDTHTYDAYVLLRQTILNSCRYFLPHFVRFFSSGWDEYEVSWTIRFFKLVKRSDFNCFTGAFCNGVYRGCQKTHHDLSTPPFRSNIEAFVHVPSHLKKKILSFIFPKNYRPIWNLF